MPALEPGTTVYRAGCFAYLVSFVNIRLITASSREKEDSTGRLTASAVRLHETQQM